MMMADNKTLEHFGIVVKPEEVVFLAYLHGQISRRTAAFYLNLKNESDVQVLAGRWVKSLDLAVLIAEGR